MAGDVSVQVLCADALEVVALQSAKQCLALTAAYRMFRQTKSLSVTPCQFKRNPIPVLADLHWQLTLEAKPVDLQLSAFVT